MKTTSRLRDWLPRFLLLASFALASGPAVAAAAPKVRICHFPPGNPANVQLLTVGAAAVPAHLTQHSDAACAAGASDCCFRGGSAPSRCTDFRSDPNNCGSCGNVCAPGTTCSGGVCSCPAGTLLCNGACVDPGTDPANCGACGNACTPGTTCSDGACACPPGTLLCNDACVDPGTDPANCGACGTACAGDTTCSGGACVCPAGSLLCDGACVDPTTDPANCGACGTACATGGTCDSGQCTCPEGGTVCGGVCVDDDTDPHNCGDCGNECPDGTTCTEGSCTGSCAPGTISCGGACVNESTDPNNCGSCGNACAAGTTCANGSCVGSCPPGTTLCGGLCVNENTDANNCGSCGTVCASGSTCAGGSCQDTCPPGTAPCAGTCVNQNSDPNHCGSCGTVCGAGTTCTGGACVSTEVAGSCLPSSSLGVLIQGTTVTAYVPLGSWSETTPGVIAVQLEPTVGVPVVVGTGSLPVNSCSSNGSTGLTVCTGNSNDVYVLAGATLLNTLTAGATGSQLFSGGECMTCGVATDASTGLAWIAEGASSTTGILAGQLQSLNPATSMFAPPIDLFGEMTSENISIDPVRHLILSAVETGNFQIIDATTGRVFNSAVTFTAPNGTPLELDATAEDCITGIAVAPGEFSASMVFADLSQAVYTPGAPGVWSAPTVTQEFPDFVSFTAAGLSGVAVAPGSHLAGVTDEFGGPAFGVVQLPATSGVGLPNPVDYVAASVPNDPSGAPWNMGLDPHTMTAYSSPNTGRAILALSNVGRTFLALVDMQALLGAPRIPGTHTVDPTFDLVGSGIVTFVAE